LPRIFLFFIFICTLGISLNAQEIFPTTFSSTGDVLYKNINIYTKIKNLNIYKNRPELLESFCLDAKNTLEDGLAVDKMKNDPEKSVDKQMIKEYAKSLRSLSKQDEAIQAQLSQDINKLYKNRDFKTLEKLEKAGIVLDSEIISAIKKSKIKVKNVRKKEIKTAKIEEKIIAVEEVIPLSDLEFYERSLKDLKDELYTLRETNDYEKMACLNDITAINYWILKILKDEKDSCLVVESIKQMKTYDKTASASCGASSMRYIEWHGRIRPYVGEKLFEAESICN